MVRPTPTCEILSGFPYFWILPFQRSKKLVLRYPMVTNINPLITILHVAKKNVDPPHYLNPDQIPRKIRFRHWASTPELGIAPAQKLMDDLEPLEEALQNRHWEEVRRRKEENGSQQNGRSLGFSGIILFDTHFIRKELGSGLLFLISYWVLFSNTEMGFCGVLWLWWSNRCGVLCFIW